MPRSATAGLVKKINESMNVAPVKELKEQIEEDYDHYYLNSRRKTEEAKMKDAQTKLLADYKKSEKIYDPTIHGEFDAGKYDRAEGIDHPRILGKQLRINKRLKEMVGPAMSDYIETNYSEPRDHSKTASDSKRNAPRNKASKTQTKSSVKSSKTSSKKTSATGYDWNTVPEHHFQIGDTVVPVIGRKRKGIVKGVDGHTFEMQLPNSKKSNLYYIKDYQVFEG